MRAARARRDRHIARRSRLHAILGVAVGADSVQFHLVPGQRHAEIAGDDVLHALDRGVLELDDPAASLADEMIVMALADGFVTRLALVKRRSYNSAHSLSRRSVR